MATPTSLPASFVSGAVLTAAQMNNLRGAFRVLQVASTVKTDAFTTTSTSYTDVTGLTVTITPSATSSKILLIACLNYSVVDNISGYGTAFRFNGGNSSTFVGDAAGSRTRAVVNFFAQDIWRVNNQLLPINMVYLDSPSTTSATTYAVQMKMTAQTGYVNRSGTDADDSLRGRGASSITALEISA
jgi:hypothetical protein